MTALKEYQRLESSGLWREHADAQRRDVLVSFGTATLVISDSAGRVLSHWSLPALVRRNPGDRPAIFAPDDSGDETLEIPDDLMIEAIEKVRSAVDRQKPRPGHLRTTVLAVAIFTLGLGAIFWLPGALKGQTMAAVPDVTRTEFGAILLGQLQKHGAVRCESPSGEEAAQALYQRLFGASSLGQIVVLKWEGPDALVLPGRLYLLNATALQRSSDPAAAAGFLLAAHAQTWSQDPLEPLLDHAGLREVMRLLTQGQILPGALEAYARDLPGTNVEAPREDLAQAFKAARISPLPYVETVGMAEPDAQPFKDNGETEQMVLTDGTWLRLQGICDG